MAYGLREGLSYCQVDGHLIFLDTKTDRYFRLSAELERTFRAHIGGEENAGVSILLEHHLLADVAEAESCAFTVHVTPPARSVVEQISHTDRVGVGTILDVFAAVCWTRLQLARNRLHRTLAAISLYRQDRVPLCPALLTEVEVQLLLHTAAAYWRARAYVPIEPRCLLDSVSIVRFLAKRGLHANIVFGVTSAPFSAHAWAQVADLVLSDSVGNASAHTPIRVV